LQSDIKKAKKAREEELLKIAKQEIVILGTGWASLALVEALDSARYNITIVSPRNYFLFTPLLPSVTVGTLDPSSIIEPIRKYCGRFGANAKYYEARCTKVDPKTNTIICEAVTHNGTVQTFTLPYDRLVIAVGAVNNTFNTPGVVEHCSFLKEIDDAKKIQRKIIDMFEAASLKDQPPEVIKKLLHFVIVGGGPNGVEFAAELHDFFKENLVHWFPDLMPYVTISLIELTDHILNTYDRKISNYTEGHFRRNAVQLVLKSMVTEVKDGSIVIKNIDSKQLEEIPFGLCVWSTGIAPNPLVKAILNEFPEEQTNRRALLTDEFMKLKGSDNIYAIGDAATVEQKKLIANFMELFRKADLDGDGFLSLKELQTMIDNNLTRYPQLEEYANKARTLFRTADTNQDNKLDAEEFRSLLQRIDTRIKFLPATAQVASQEGQYLGRQLNNVALGQPIQPFRYKHLGSFAYIGSMTAVADFTQWYQNLTLSGWGAWWLWRSVYLSKQFSLQNKIAVSLDWAKVFFFGRDITRT